MPEPSGDASPYRLPARQREPGTCTDLIGSDLMHAPSEKAQGSRAGRPLLRRAAGAADNSRRRTVFFFPRTGERAMRQIHALNFERAA
jgi:hypothetical protein